MSRIDETIHKIRRALSEIAEDPDATSQDLAAFLAVDGSCAYNSIIDSLYTLEDTQLAKHAFQELKLEEESLGMLHLLFYGILNACYMQQQALLVLRSKLGITSNAEKIRNSELMSYRNHFWRSFPEQRPRE